VIIRENTEDAAEIAGIQARGEKPGYAVERFMFS
jgi:hypothetical protein